MDYKTKQLILRALGQMQGDDLYRAKATFRHYTELEMDEQHGMSGKTRRQLIAEYQKHSDEIEAAISEVKALN